MQPAPPAAPEVHTSDWNSDAPSRRAGIVRPVALTAATMFGMTLLYQLGKMALLPSITLWQSHVITVGYCTLVATVTAYVIAHRAQRRTAALAGTIAAQAAAERALLDAHDDLERRVRERTQALTQRNADLENEIRERRRIAESLRVSEENLRNAKEAAEAASHAKSSFLATMSHEIRTPLNGVMGMTSLVLESDLEAEQREHLEVAQRSAEALIAIINDILDFSKIEAGQFELVTAPFELRQLVGDTLRSVGLRAHQKGLELVCDVEPDVPERVVGDSGRLRQVLFNLVGNALKFTEAGEVVVQLRVLTRDAEGCRVRLSVRDTGIGIPLDRQRDIFEPFRQADGSMTRRYGGTGLGLSISSRLIGLMGGTISLESTPGVGSTFHADFRLEIDQRPPSADLARIRRALAGRDVLIVDDNTTNRQVLSGMVSRWGASPTEVEGGVAALDVLDRWRERGQRTPIVLLDGHMPGLDGFATARAIRAGHGDGPDLLLLTSADHMQDAATCASLGIAAYLVKPVREMDLLDAMLQLVIPAAAAHSDAPAADAQGGAAPEVAGPLPSDDVAGQPTGAPARPTAAARRASGKRVLLVEDHPVNQLLVVRSLERYGHAVTVAGTGRQGVEACLRETFDLVLMDVQMPDMDGLEATRLIRASDTDGLARVPIVALTAHALTTDRARCRDAGMDDFLSKPVRPHELEAIVARWTGVDAAPQAVS